MRNPESAKSDPDLSPVDHMKRQRRKRMLLRQGEQLQESQREAAFRLASVFSKHQLRAMLARLKELV